MACLSETARWLGDQLRDSEHFEVITDGSAIPVVSFRLKGDPGYTEFDVSHALRVLRLAGAGLHDARRRQRRHGAARRGAGGLLRPTWPGRSRTTLITVLKTPRRAQAARPLRRGAALRALGPATPARRGSGTIDGGDMTMQTTQLPTSTAAAQAVVDLGAIAHNVRLLREHAGSAEVMAVVKADGYGHGAARVGQAALAAGAAELGVATLDEALALRRDGVTAPVLALAARAGHRLRPRAGRPTSRSAVSSTRQLAERARRRRAHRPHGDGHGQGRHRAEPQRRRAPPSSRDCWPRCAGRAADERDPAARHHVAPGLRRRSRQPRQRPAGATVLRDAGAGPRRRRATSRSPICPTRLRR